MAAGDGLKNTRTVKTNPTAKAKEIKVGEINPSDLRDWDGDQLYVRNNTPHRVVFDDLKKNEMTLNGIQTGEHILPLEIAIARNPGFQKMWRKGGLSVSTDPAMEDELWLAETEADKRATESGTGMTFVPSQGEATAVFSAKIDDYYVPSYGEDLGPRK